MVPVLRPAVCCLRDETGRSRRPPMAWSGPGHSNACPAASLLIFTPNARWQSATGLPVCRDFPCTGLVGGSTIPCSTYAFVIHTTHAHARFTIADHTSPHPTHPSPPPAIFLLPYHHLQAASLSSPTDRRPTKKEERRKRTKSDVVSPGSIQTTQLHHHQQPTISPSPHQV